MERLNNANGNYDPSTDPNETESYRQPCPPDEFDPPGGRQRGMVWTFFASNYDDDLEATRCAAVAYAERFLRGRDWTLHTTFAGGYFGPGRIADGYELELIAYGE